MEPANPNQPADSFPPVEDATPAPPRRKQFGWSFWVTLTAVVGLLVAIAIPNFVRARTTVCKNACIANLKQIDGAVQQWALEHKKAGTDIVTTTDILDFLKGSALPLCEENGTYSVSTVSSTPQCTRSVNGHSL